jgi:hypothetical protein
VVEEASPPTEGLFESVFPQSLDFFVVGLHELVERSLTRLTRFVDRWHPFGG